MPPGRSESEEERKLRLLNKKLNRMKKKMDAICKHTGLTEAKLDKILNENKKKRPDIELANKIWAKKKGMKPPKGAKKYTYFDALKEARSEMKKR